VIDWTTYVPVRKNAKLGMKPETPCPRRTRGLCIVKGKHRQRQEGIDNLNKALQLRPDYDDAMAYITMYREHADIQSDLEARRPI